MASATAYQLTTAVCDLFHYQNGRLPTDGLKSRKQANGKANGLKPPVPKIRQKSPERATETNESTESTEPTEERLYEVLRPLGFLETVIAKCNDFGVGDVVYALLLRSEVPVDDLAVVAALKALQGKFAHLRLAIHRDPKDDKRMFVDVKNQGLKFENRGREPWRKVFEDMLTTEYDASRGPLWQVRITRMDKEDEEDCRVQNGRRYHGYVILFGFHHAITDGTSNAILCNRFLENLNAVLSGKAMPAHKEIRVPPSLKELIEPKYRDVDVVNPKDLFSLASDVYTYGINNFSVFQQRYPPPEVTKEARSLIVTRDLTVEQTSSLLRACKANKVTVGGAFSAAASIAIFNLTTKQGAPKELAVDRLKFCVNHAVNLRRYFENPRSEEEACGCYFNFFDDHVVCGKDSLQNFWEVAREQTLGIRRGVENRRALVKQRNLEWILGHLYSLERYCRWRRRTPIANCEFSTSNLGNLDNSFSGKGSPVEVMKVYRSTAMHYLPSLFTWFFQTFRGRLLCLLEFYTNFCDRERAQEYMDETMRVLTHVIDS